MFTHSPLFLYLTNYFFRTIYCVHILLCSMSDVHVDKLNNSQLILLVLLISLVVSAATAVAVLSVVYERLALATGEEAESQPTIIRQTINRIIERDPVLLSSEVAASTQPESSVGTALTLEIIEQSLARLYFGSQPFSYGVYVSPEGYILASEVLDEQRRYSVLDAVGQPIFFSLLYSGEEYSLLAPIDVGAHRVQHYVSLVPVTDVSLGESVIVFGGFGQQAQIHTGIVSQKRVSGDAAGSVRISVPASSVADTSALFIEDSFAGFVQPYVDWIPLLDSAFVAGAMEAIRTHAAAEYTAPIDTDADAELSQ